MKKHFKKAVFILAAVLMVATTFTACDMGLPWDIEVWGEWHGDNSAYGYDDTVITVTNTTITFDNPAEWAWDYAGDIVKYDNSSFNISSENPTSGNFGYLIFKITEHESEYAQNQVGKYTVIRWKALTDTSLEYSEAGTQFDTIEEAEAADADNFATDFSTLTKATE